MLDLRTARLRLRANLPQDVDAVMLMARDWLVVRNLAGWPWPADRDFAAGRCLPIPPQEGFGGAVCLDDQLIGGMGVVLGHLGYMFARAHWGHGYATEIGQAVVDHAFASYTWPVIQADVWADNPASARVLTKLGFEPVGKAMRPCAAQGREVPAIDYALTRARWTDRKTAREA